MRKDIIMRVMLTAVMMGLVGVLISGNALAAISGSVHDFSGKTWNPSGELCKVCHTPHNALSTLVPLWNHATTATIFTLYSSSTLNATVGQPAGVSKACLSCHDGTVAVDSFGGATGTTYITAANNLGIDLSNDHPVSFTYDAALVTADGGLVTPVSSSKVDTEGKVRLFSSKLECASCHDAHNKATLANLLVKSNAASALCLTCHNK